MSPPNTNTRWCPTPEQLMILEELYRRGLKTPNTTQIQRITGHLSMYGKIQGKNVFYWFQNHKARDRQKLRKRLAKQLHLLLPQPQFHYFPRHFPPNFLHEGTSNGGVCNEIMTTNVKPLETLELFPLHSTKDVGNENENPTSS